MVEQAQHVPKTSSHHHHTTTTQPKSLPGKPHLCQKNPFRHHQTFLRTTTTTATIPRTLPPPSQIHHHTTESTTQPKLKSPSTTNQSTNRTHAPSRSVAERGNRDNRKLENGKEKMQATHRSLLLKERDCPAKTTNKKHTH
jgi:hypothetical protein